MRINKKTVHIRFGRLGGCQTDTDGIQQQEKSVHYVTHGGVVIVSTPGVIVAKINVKLKLTTFEVMCCLITSGGASFILVNIYRPGSALLSDM